MALRDAQPTRRRARRRRDPRRAEARRATSATPTVINGRLTGEGAFTSNPTGRLQGRDAILNFGGGLGNLGDLQISFGTSDIFGSVTIALGGSIVNSGSGNATFYDPLEDDGELRTAADSPSVFFGEYTGTGSLTGSGVNSFEGGFWPGASPFLATSTADDVFGGSNVTMIELAGTTRPLARTARSTVSTCWAAAR